MEDPQKSSAGKNARPSSLLRTITLIIVGLGGVTSLALVQWAGRTNKHVWLTILFIFWVLAPFIAGILASRFAKRWSFQAHAVIYFAMLVIALASMVVYINDAIHPREAQRAFVFVIVPGASLVFLAMGFLVAFFMSRKRSLH